jgi:HD superfamily phosphodiesterase
MPIGVSVYADSRHASTVGTGIEDLWAISACWAQGRHRAAAFQGTVRTHFDVAGSIRSGRVARPREIPQAGQYLKQRKFEEIARAHEINQNVLMFWVATSIGERVQAMRDVVDRSLRAGVSTAPKHS